MLIVIFLDFISKAAEAITFMFFNSKAAEAITFMSRSQDSILDQGINYPE
jgi:hypothetical protein